MKKFGFIGMGNMGTAMFYGMRKFYGAEDFIFSRRDQKKGEEFSREYKIHLAKNNIECAREAKYVILAVKPQYFAEVASEIRDVLTKEQVLFSIAAGIDTKKLKELFHRKSRVVWAIPNTPAMVGEGMTGICFEEKEFTEEECQTIENIFSSFGRVKKVEEKLMNSVICASGSSPAYVYLFLEALADSAVKYGIPRQEAYEMAAQTVLGAAKMVLETKEHPASLKDKVCSPGGTTIAGVAALEEYGMRNAIFKATDACYKKAVDMQLHIH